MSERSSLYGEELPKDSDSESAEIGRVPNRDICSCGHPSRSHYEYREGQIMCQVAKMYCPCVQLIPVLRVSDTRLFQFKSRGSGARHALSLGVSLLLGKGGTYEEVLNRTCFACKRDSQSLAPVSMNEYRRLLDGPGPYTVLLCSECRINPQWILNEF